MTEKLESKFKWGAAIATTLVSVVIYLMTMAPTVSFWDCGEFIASAHTLGIPHPPGTPFFVMLARVAIIIFGFIPEIALRVNLISVFTSALAVGVSTLVSWEALSLVWPKRKAPINSNQLKLFGALTSGFLVAFSDTFWFNAVEAEVYGLAMLFVFGITYVSLLWIKNRNNGLGDRLLIFIVYIAFLGIGVHLYSMLTLPAVFLLVVLYDERFRSAKAWPIWVTSLLLYSVVYMVDKYINISIVLLAITGVLTLVIAKEDNKFFKLSFWFTLVAILGFSTHAYIPIRSSMNPIIDENNPEIPMAKMFNPSDSSWNAFNGFIARKQYGSESMVTRASHRRGDILNQLLTFPHMGYGGYQIAQYLPWKVGFVDFVKKGEYVISPSSNTPIVRAGIEFKTQMMLFGENKFLQFLAFALFNALIFGAVWLFYKLDRRVAIYLGLIYALTSFGLVYYMNFADGTGSERRDFEAWVKAGKPSSGPNLVHQEVRERDYFYTPAYVMMSILLGSGLSLMLLQMGTRQKKPFMDVKFLGSGAVALALIVPVYSNYEEHDRSGLYIPWDYAWNLIQSVEPNGILFTNGDNDTFPLWFIQEVENVRKDVRVVNLSLGNTDWYISQITAQAPKANLDLLGPNLDKLKYGIGKESFLPQAQRILSKLKTDIPMVVSRLGAEPNDSIPALNESDKARLVQQLKLMKNEEQALTSLLEWDQRFPIGYLRVQDLLVLDIVRSNPDRPISFAATVGRDNFVGLDRYMNLEGMVWKLNRGTIEPQGGFETEKTVHLIDSVYQFRGINDPEVFVSDETQRLLYSYSNLFTRVSLAYRDSLINIAKGLPSGINKTEVIEKAEWSYNKGVSLFPEEWRHYVVMAENYQADNQIAKAVDVLEKGLENVPDERGKKTISDRLARFKSLNTAQ